MSTTHRILAEYATHDELVEALKQLRQAGYSHLEVYTPFASEEIDDALEPPPTPIGWIMLLGGVIGCTGAYFMEWYSAHAYAYNVGGRPLTSWPSFIPVVFELTVLCTALTGLLALLFLTRLPRLHHPVFNAAPFRRASADRFFVAVCTDDPRLTSVGVEPLLREAGALSIQEVAE